MEPKVSEFLAAVRTANGVRKRKAISMIIKMWGLDVDQLSRLQKALESDAARSKEAHWNNPGSGRSFGRVVFAELLKTRYQKESKTHSAEIAVNTSVIVWTSMDALDTLYTKKEIFAPRRVLDVICRALGEHYFPEQEATETS